MKLFVKYIEVTRSSVVVLEDEDGFFCYLPYRHRFSDVSEIIQRFYEVFEKASRRYRVGVWLTLTFNPKDLEKMDYLSYRYYAMKCLNRFLSWLRKRYRGVDWAYLCSIEFMENGLIHFHIVVFGLRRIEDAYVFMRRLRGWGFGYVHYMYVIVNRDGNWFPAKVVRVDNCDGAGLPKELLIASRIGLKNYLAKYMSKTLKAIKHIYSILSSSTGTLDSIYSVSQTSLQSGISQNSYGLSKNGTLATVTSTIISNIWKLALYWALRLRFFSYSKNIMVSSKRIRIGRYSFIGVFSIERYIFYNNYFHDWLLYPAFLCIDVVSATEVIY